MKILLISSASVSVHLSAKLHRRFLDDGHEVAHCLTENAYELWKQSGRFNEDCKKLNVKTWNGTFADECLRHFRDDNGIAHIQLVEDNDVCVVCPADFNIIGKMAIGIADDVPSSTLAAWLGSGKPIYIAEAMNTMMYQNPAHLANVECLKRIQTVHFIKPTVKKLACGSYGIGGLADVNAIADIVEGHDWMQPVQSKDLIGSRTYVGNDTYSVNSPRGNVSLAEYLPTFSEPGAFGALRKHDRHEGVDIYCVEGASVFAVEDGEVVDSYQYTGEAANCGWWKDTWCIKVKGHSGVVTYGELKMPDEAHEAGVTYPAIGTKVKAGDFIGVVGTVLKDGKLRLDIRNHNTSMLHMELRKENCHIDGWKLDEDRDPRLLDPSPYLYSKKLKPCQPSK